VRASCNIKANGSPFRKALEIGLQRLVEIIEAQKAGPVMGERADGARQAQTQFQLFVGELGAFAKHL
jgi:hypothetical protein